MAFRETAGGLITQNNSQSYKFIIPLEADDHLAAKAAIAKLSSIWPAPPSSTMERMRAVIVQSASMRATWFNPCGDARGFAFSAILCALIWRSENHPSFAA